MVRKGFLGKIKIIVLRSKKQNRGKEMKPGWGWERLENRVPGTGNGSAQVFWWEGAGLIGGTEGQLGRR